MEINTTIILPDDDQDYLPASVATVDSDGSVTVTGEFNETYKPNEWESILIEKVPSS